MPCTGYMQKNKIDKKCEMPKPLGMGASASQP